MPDRDGYPTNVELRRIRRWPINTGADCTALLVFVRECWWNAEWGWTVAARLRRERVGGTAYRLYQISTGGWSGNEDIIAALDHNVMFQMLCFDSHRRGGHYTYRVPEAMT